MDKISKVPKDNILSTYYLKGHNNNNKLNEEKLLGGSKLIKVLYDFSHPISTQIRINCPQD